MAEDTTNGAPAEQEGPTPEQQVQLQGAAIQSLQNQLGVRAGEIADRDVQIAVLRGQIEQLQQQTPAPDELTPVELVEAEAVN